LIQSQPLARCGFKRTRWLEDKRTQPYDAVSDLEASIYTIPRRVTENDLAFAVAKIRGGNVAKRSEPTPQYSGLHHARESRGMSRSELVRLSGISKQQLSRLENGLIRLRLDHLELFAPHLGYTPEQILLWGRFPSTEAYGSETQHARPAQKQSTVALPRGIPELDSRTSSAGGAKRDARRKRPHIDHLKAERWTFPEAFIREQLHTPAEKLLVVESSGDSMTPTITSGERVIIDIDHKTPSPDGLYAIRDAFGSIIVRRLQVLRSSRPTGVRVISDNPNHPDEETPLSEIEIVGKVLCCLKLC
jgi:transcriptional regulator with XRE-family HTH domain